MEKAEMKTIKRKSSSLLLLVWVRFSLLIFLLLFHLKNLFCALDENGKWENWREVSSMKDFCKLNVCWKSLQLKLIVDKHQLSSFRWKSLLCLLSEGLCKPYMCWTSSFFLPVNRYMKGFNENSSKCCNVV